MALESFPVPATGGLNLVSPPQVLAQNPGGATVLENFECLPEGGYRRINGFAKFGDIPDVIGEQDIRGIAYYNGVVVVCGKDVLHSPDGNSWYIVNREGMNNVEATNVLNYTEKPRLGSKTVEFTKSTKGNQEVLVISDDVSPPAMLTIDGTRYSYSETDVVATKGMRFLTSYQDHVVIAGSYATPGTIAVSDRFDPLGYEGSGAWSAQVADEITGLHTFRDYLYIFCKNSIYRVINLESAKDIAIRPVTTKIGCVDGRTIQEVGGDILFLANDGLRYLGATERLDDVSLNVMSEPIRPIVDSIEASRGPISSVVISDKSQYRLFFTDNLGIKKGIIGTLQPDGSFSWSTTSDMLVEDITSSTVGTDTYIYHIGSPTVGVKRIYRHDVGDTKDGAPVIGTYATNEFHMGDSAIRKSLHFINVYLEAEDKAVIQLDAIYDHQDPKVLQPEPFELSPVVQAARWGEMVWGQSEYGAVRFPLSDIFMEGSGKWIQLKFTDNADDNSPYVIRGFDLQYTPAGRI